MKRTGHIALQGGYSSRLGSVSKDRRQKNCIYDYVENDKGEVEKWTVKRSGFTQHLSDTAAAGRGIYQWKGLLYAVIGSVLYKDGVSIKSNLTNSTGLVQWTEEHKTDLLIFRDGDKIVTVNVGDSVTELTDGDIPTSLVPGIVTLDTFVFVMNTDGEIYNSNLDNVTSWTAGHFITAKEEADDGVAIFKHHNYIAALGDWTLEFFYNAVNPTGTPLRPVSGTVDMVGCVSGDTVYADENIAIWVTKTRTGVARVAVLDSLKIKYLSTPAIERIINQEDTNLDNARAWGIRISGRLYYVLTLTADKLTLVVDVESGDWFDWNSDDGTTETYFTGIASTQLDGRNYVLDEDNGKIYEMDFDIYQDDTQDINVEIVTGNWDAKSSRYKFIHRVGIVGDEQTSTSNITLDMTLDDYKTYIASRTVDMSTTDPAGHQWGRVNRAAFRLKHTANTPLRVKELDIAYTLGSYGGGND